MVVDTTFLHGTPVTSDGETQREKMRVQDEENSPQITPREFHQPLPGRKSPSDSLSLPYSPSRTQCLSTSVLRSSSVTGESPERPVVGHRQRPRRPWSASRRSPRH